MKTPCRGLLLKRTSAGVPVIRLHYSADPRLTPEVIKQMRAAYSSDAYWNREMEIEYGALDGATVYPEFNAAIHVIPDDQVPRRGCRYMSIDPHPRTPHAFLWLLIDRWSDWYIYRDLWPSIVCGDPRRLRDDEEDHSYTISEYAETVAVLEGNVLRFKNPETDREYALYERSPYHPQDPHRSGERIIFRLMDQAGKGFKATGEADLVETYARRYLRYGIQCEDPKKSHQTGEDAVRELLKPRRHDTKGEWPRLHIAQSCKELITEFPLHKYMVTKGASLERDLKQDRAQFRCHQLDNLRYLATSGASYIASLES